MQITFNPMDPAERSAVINLLGQIDSDDAPATRWPAGTTALAQAGIGTDAVSEDTRSAAEVFGGAPPLSDVQLGAGATPLDNAPAVLPGSSLPMQTGLPGLAPAGLPAGAPPANAAAGSPAGGVELDTQGIPWHHEIHASTRTKTKAGIWTKLRGMNDEAKYNRIVAELKALHAMPAPAAAPAAPLQPLQPAAAPAVAQTLPTTLPPLQPLQPLTPTVPQNFDEMMPRITAAIVAKLLPEDIVAKACAARQLPGAVSLVTRPDFVPQIWADIQAAYPALV